MPSRRCGAGSWRTRRCDVRRAPAVAVLARAANPYRVPVASTLYRHGVVHTSADPFAEAILVEDGVVAWLG